MLVSSLLCWSDVYLFTFLLLYLLKGIRQSQRAVFLELEIA